ncbi:MAG: hypothetical protein LBQ54_04995, partial [Planctomycetaceae bacterium]|nr:hypothetical protein [Planctomycetaceae bacterium]
LGSVSSFHTATPWRAATRGRCIPDGTAVPKAKPVRVAHWCPSAEQREKNDNERRPRSREAIGRRGFPAAVKQHASLRRETEIHEDASENIMDMDEGITKKREEKRGYF